MILSDHTIREELAAGRIVLEPFDESLVQPSSVDVRLDRYFRVFLNHTMAVIDVKKNLEELTRLVEIGDERPFVLHPGEFVLASTLERVALPADLVGRVEGKSSLGRLGLLIHSSLPASEPLLVRDADGLQLRTIGEIVKEPRPCQVVSFDPDTFKVGYHEVTGFYAGPEDRIFEVELASGRKVRITAGHNLFTLDSDGEIRKVRTAELEEGVLIAVAGSIPEPPEPRNEIRVLDLVPEAERTRLTIEGPSVARAFELHAQVLPDLLRQAGYAGVTYYRRRGRLPWSVAAHVPGLIQGLTDGDRVGRRGERHTLPVAIQIDQELAWLLGMYVAEGFRRSSQIVISNTDQSRLDRLEATFARMRLPVYRSAGAVTCCSSLVSDLMGWMGTGGHAPTKRIPPMAFGWSDDVLRQFLMGLVDGDGSTAGGRTSVWTTSEGLVADVLLVMARLGMRCGSCRKETANLPLWQVYAPDGEHKLLTTVPLPDRLLRRARETTGLSQATASKELGYAQASGLNNIERRCGRDAVRLATLRRLRDLYSASGAEEEAVARIARLADGDVRWDRVVAVRDTGRHELIYDIEVRPGGRKIENFLAGSGGVFVSNTAGFIDAGFDGHITLELSNVANLPITLYPGMKIGQISFLRMTTPADVPYGSDGLKSKYQGQRGPTPSRYWENFEADPPT